MMRLVFVFAVVVVVVALVDIVPAWTTTCTRRRTTSCMVVEGFSPSFELLPVAVRRSRRRFYDGRRRRAIGDGVLKLNMLMEQHRDIVIVGGGLAGLSAAFYLKTASNAGDGGPPRHVTILDSDECGTASIAAAGMLAPHSERLPAGDLLELCCASRNMYREFIQQVEQCAKQSGTEGYQHLKHNAAAAAAAAAPTDSSSECNLEPWQVGYVSSGGFLAPALAGDSVATWSPPENSRGTTAAIWLDATQVRELEPSLHPSNIVGGWWFPEDASVDAKRLTHCLRAACVALGIQFLQGPEYKVTSLDFIDNNNNNNNNNNNSCRGVWCQNGMYIHTTQLLIANGAWMRQLLPVPLEPHKGQSISLRMPSSAGGSNPILRRVLFAQDSYICPKPDGRIVIGSTVEAGTFDPNVTPAGLMHILQHAIQLVPALAHLPMEHYWVGLRPTTPDKGPILGQTPWCNVYVAGGYWRNGVLLAPKTGHLMATLMLQDAAAAAAAAATAATSKQQKQNQQQLSKQDQEFLQAFAWNRFTSPRSSNLLNANARYAASMHPVHTRASGMGIAASVGTELGAYSTARDARQERQRDREALFGTSSSASSAPPLDLRFEQAAALGKQDAQVYTGLNHDDDNNYSNVNKANKHNIDYDDDGDQGTTTQVFEGSADAFTVGSSSSSSDSGIKANTLKREKDKEEKTEQDESSSLDTAYQFIRTNKQQQQQQERPSSYLVDDDLDDNNDEQQRPDPGFRIHHVDPSTAKKREVPPYTKPTDFLQALKQQQQQKQTPPAKQTAIVSTVEDDDDDNDTVEEQQQQQQKEDLARVYQSIRANKQQQQQQHDKTWAELLQEEEQETNNNDMTIDDRPDPGFRIYHIDPQTGEQRMVPPYTSPGDFLRQIQTQQTNNKNNNNQKSTASATATKSAPQTSTRSNNGTRGTPDNNSDAHSEQTFDGYTAIQQANSRSSRQEELKAMKLARQQNRLEDTNVTQIGILEDWDTI